MKKIILVYHQIDGSDPFMSVALNEFKKQITYLKVKKFNFCDVKEILEKSSGNSVCIMFDDGYKSIEPAINYLKNQDLKYSISVIENKIGKENYLAGKDLDTNTVYFHTKNHVDLTKLSEQELKSELCCNYSYYSNCVVYPMGRYNQNVINVVKNNFEYGLSLLPFHISKRSNDYELPRICINGYLSFLKFKLFMSKLGNLYLHLAFFKRKLLGQDYLSK